MELRCKSSILHGVMRDDGLFETTCRSKRCGKEPGIVVLHRFNINTGELVDTVLFRQPKGQTNGIG